MANILIPLNFTADLDKGTRQEELKSPLVQGDSSAHRITLTLQRGGSPPDLTGASVTCYVVLSTRQTVVVSGAISGNTAMATLNEACYAVPGRIHILMRLSVSGQIETPLYLTGSVISGTTDAVIDPEDIVPSLEELLAQIAAMEQATAASIEATNAANTAALSANSGAAAAEVATEAANAAADRLDNLTVGITMLPASDEPDAVVTVTQEAMHAQLMIPYAKIAMPFFQIDSSMDLYVTVPDGWDGIAFGVTNGVLEVAYNG